MNSEVRATVIWALNYALESYAAGHIIEHPPAIKGRIDAALAELAALEQAGTWEPLTDGRYDGGDVYYYFWITGSELCVFEAETGDGWPLQLPKDIRLCRRTTAQEQAPARPDA